MPPRSLLTRAEVDVAKKAHNCQANARHRIERGDKRFNIRNGRSWDRYCIECAKDIVRRDTANLEDIVRKLDPDTA